MPPPYDPKDEAKAFVTVGCALAAFIVVVSCLITRALGAPL